MCCSPTDGLKSHQGRNPPPIKRLYIWSCLHQIGYRDKAREEASRGGSLAFRPDITLATEVSKLTSQVHPTKSTICLMKPWTSHTAFPLVP